MSGMTYPRAFRKEANALPLYRRAPAHCRLRVSSRVSIPYGLAASARAASAFSPSEAEVNDIYIDPESDKEVRQ
jgi:hypothetical protein